GRVERFVGGVSRRETEDHWGVPSKLMPIRKPRDQASVQNRRVLPCTNSNRFGRPWQFKTGAARRQIEICRRSVSSWARAEFVRRGDHHRRTNFTPVSLSCATRPCTPASRGHRQDQSQIRAT